MSRHRPMRGVKFCAHCGSGYDAFKAMELRGRYCSPDCLSAARQARRAAGLLDETLLGNAPVAAVGP
ncbi:MAG: hypothetical protein ABR564_05045 [Candidatus Dormibacteria bacterium]